MLMNWLALLTNLNAANSDIILFEVFVCLEKGSESVILHLLVGALITKELKILQSFHLVAGLRPI